MKKFILLSFFSLVYLRASAQHRDSMLEDSILYWITWVPPKPWKPLTADGRTLTVGQKAEMYKLVDWMMQSYHPVGGVGSFKSVLNVRTSSDFKDYRPHSYYLDFRVWDVSYDKRDANGNFTAVSETYKKFPVGFNQLPSNPIEFLNGPQVCYFTWQAQDDKSRLAANDPYKHADPKISATCAPFIVRNRAVILAPNNQLPFHRVTVGEFLDACESALPYALGVAKAHKDPKYQDGMEADYARYRTWIRKWKHVYAGKLDQPATVVDDPVTLSGTFDADVDPFRKLAETASYEIWKMNPDVFEKAKQDKPLFITFTIPFWTRADGIQKYELYQALTQNVNYHYIYDYFFDPVKVKGKVYKPADEPGMLKRLSSYKGKLPDGTRVGMATGSSNRPSITKASTKPAPGLLLDDNFTSAPVGRMPVGWYVRSVGQPSSIQTIQEFDGNWLRLGSNATFPTTLPTLLPENFTLDLDVVTVSDFAGRTGGQLLIHFSNGTGYSVNGDEVLRPDRITLDLKLIAGSDADRLAASNFRGGIELEMHEAGGANSERNREGLYLKKPLPDFTSRRTKIHVTLELKGGQCAVFINNKKVVDPTELKLSYDSNCRRCGLSAGKPFSLLNFRNVDNTGADFPVYIGNVKLIKK
ncbi:hypothetical protein [Spirosoma fluviale]|nr:hypothetical protein [Spirosoma fluviale]